MILHGRGHRLLGAILLLTAIGAKAGAIQDPSTSAYYFKNFAVSAAGGASWYNTPNTSLVISPFETDSVQVDHSSGNGSWKVGMGFYLLKDALQQQYLNQLLLEVNVYQTSGALDGSVWQYEQPQFNNYSFSTPIKSTSLMLDFKPNLFTWQKISPYTILGVGMAFNTVSYTETATGRDIDPTSALSLSKNTTTHVAWDLGAGFRMELSDKLSATVEYLYAFLGHNSPADGNILTTSPRFSLRSQSLLFGLSLKL